MLPFKTPLIIGSIIVSVTANDGESGMDTVEFYINNDLKITDSSPPWEWRWTELHFGLATIKIIAYDNEENFCEDEISVKKYL